MTSNEFIDPSGEANATAGDSDAMGVEDPCAEKFLPDSAAS